MRKHGILEVTLNNNFLGHTIYTFLCLNFFFLIFLNWEDYKWLTVNTSH